MGLSQFTHKPVSLNILRHAAPDETATETPCPTLLGYLAHKKEPPPQDHRRALGMVLLYGPRGALFLMSEVPLYSRDSGP